jgi:SOS-response transcriptional repressor LexA
VKTGKEYAREGNLSSVSIVRSHFGTKKCQAMCCPLTIAENQITLKRTKEEQFNYFQNNGGLVGSYKGDNTTGFQSPAQDYVEPVIDLAEVLNLRAPGIYPVRVIGHQLRRRGIFHGDILIANAAAEPVVGKVCVAFLHGEVILATLTRNESNWHLTPSNGAAVPVSDEVEIWAIIDKLVRTKV